MPNWSIQWAQQGAAKITLQIESANANANTNTLPLYTATLGDGCTTVNISDGCGSQLSIPVFSCVNIERISAIACGKALLILQKSEPCDWPSLLRPGTSKADINASVTCDWNRWVYDEKEEVVDMGMDMGMGMDIDSNEDDEVEEEVEEEEEEEEEEEVEE